jgi:hypothetical protein
MLVMDLHKDCVDYFLQLRKFIKKCKVPSYTRMMKEVIAKTTETSAVITERRRTATLDLRDLSAVVNKIPFTVYCIRSSSASAITQNLLNFSLWQTVCNDCLGNNNNNNSGSNGKNLK